MPIYLYGCTKGHRSEAIRPVGTTHLDCPHCGESSPRVYGYSMALVQPEVDVRGMYRRFNEATQEMDHRASRIEASTGQPVETPNLWRAAKARAQAMTAAGENDARRQW